MKANLIEFRNRSKYINEQKHPEMDLLIWNYTPECQFSRSWDKYTKMCRGLITDLEGNIVARPFEKFFNWGEDSLKVIPSEMPIISEKMDGSLGILYFDGEKPCIATRGSFTSDQANWATHYMNIVCGFTRKDFKEGYTYLFEILYPENRIVVDYKGRSELVLLAIINTENGDETYLKVEDEANRLGLSFATRYEVKNIQEILDRTDTLSGNEEGYVFHWPHHDNLRLKIKGKEYVRLHKLLTEFSTISIWECLKEKEDMFKLLEKVPDEFYSWVREQHDKLVKEYSDIFESAEKAWIDIAVLPTRKEQALAIKEKYPDMAGLVFTMLDGQDPSKIIWRQIRPKFEKPFSRDIDL